MSTPNNKHSEKHRAILTDIAWRVMSERGLRPEFTREDLKELDGLKAPTFSPDKKILDLRSLPWSSIDNDDSLDLDQLTVAEQLPDDCAKIRVAVADVDELVHRNSAIDEHAHHNTTSVYTAAVNFPMLPDQLSTDLTSLNLNQDRLAIVINMVIAADGSLKESSVCRAFVHNHAKLAYNSVAAWLDQTGEMPQAMATVPGLVENIVLQDKTAQKMKAFRYAQGSLTFETIKSKSLFDHDMLRDLIVEDRNRAKDLIEDFMVMANGVIARFLASKNFPSLRRVVRVPKRWDRIVEIARAQGFKLSDRPDSKQLEKFLTTRRKADPQRFPDLSLSIIKLLGAGEYVAEIPQETEAPGHFGLAVKDYAHFTAPNRRYPDLVMQRLLKASLAGQPIPYANHELAELGAYCTEREDAAKKVERQVDKSAAALLLESHIGQKFDAFVTGASSKGTWARLIQIPVEGKMISGIKGLDVGDRIRVQLLNTDVENGYIDLKRA